jgi:hypothetical protein
VKQYISPNSLGLASGQFKVSASVHQPTSSVVPSLSKTGTVPFLWKGCLLTHFYYFADEALLSRLRTLYAYSDRVEGSISFLVDLDDELISYFAEPTPCLSSIINGKVVRLCPLKWWKHAEQRYSQLATLARHFFSLLVTSVSSEHSFSLADWMFSKRRSSLSDDNVTAMMFLNGNAHHRLHAPSQQ